MLYQNSVNQIVSKQDKTNLVSSQLTHSTRKHEYGNVIDYGLVFDWFVAFIDWFSIVAIGGNVKLSDTAWPVSLDVGT